MKVAALLVENFRGIEWLDLDRDDSRSAAVPGGRPLTGGGYRFRSNAPVARHIRANDRDRLRASPMSNRAVRAVWSAVGL